ncbi:MAG: hypothetical protein JSS94_02985 [Bacteroidetes bacterium]|nr:hypothetical protein [Bacteroidota bacterium]
MKKIIFYLWIGLISIVSCNPNDEGYEPQPSNNEPRNGSKWVYKITRFNEAGQTTDTFNVTLKATEITYDNSSWLSLVEQDGQTQIIALKKKSDGWWYTQPSATGASLWYKTPAQVGESFPYLYGTCSVMATNTSLIVPAGEYTVVTKIDGHDDNSLEDEFWFAQDPVLIKLNTYDALSGQPQSNVYKKETWELVSYIP